MTWGSATRYILLASPPRRYITVSQAILVVAGILGDMFWTMDASFVLVTIMLLQMFACSTGYVTHGTRGLYDPVLTAGWPRWRIALAHFAASAGPGFLAWVCFGAYSAIRGGAESGLAFRPTSLVFFGLVSVGSWAMTLRFPPLSGGVLWVMVMIATALSSQGFGALATRFDDPAALMERPWASLATGLLIPMIMFGAAWPFPLLVALATIAIVVLAVGALYISKRDLPLAEEE